MSKKNTTINIDVTSNRAIALQEANFAVTQSNSEIVDVEIAREVVLPLADLYLAYLDNEVPDAPAAPAETAAAAPERDANAFIAELNEKLNENNFGAHVDQLIRDGIAQVSWTTSFDAAKQRAGELINANESQLGSRNATALRQIVESVR